VTHTPLPTRAGSHGANFLSGQMGQLPRCGRTVDRRLLPEPVFGVHLSISAARCVLPSPLPVPHLPLPHHSHAHNGVHCSCLLQLASSPCAWPGALLLAEAADQHARRARPAARRQLHAQSDRAGSSACLPGARVPARRVLLSLAGSHSRSPPPLAGLADGTNLLCHYKRDRVPAAVGRGRSAAVRVTILGR
jgi:hypothetical protein